MRDSSMAGLDVTAYWELLTPNPTPIPEPINEDLSISMSYLPIRVDSTGDSTIH